MFLFICVLLIWALLTFGAVVPSSSLLIMLVWLLGIACAAVYHILRQGRLPLLLLAALAAGGAAMLFLGPKLGLWIFALLSAWWAARERPARTLQYFHLLLILGCLEAALGLAQYFFAPGWILGYVNTSGNAVSGTFINRNHFAGLLELLIPCAIGLGFIAARRRDISRSYLYMLAGAFMALALVFTLSRMGMFSFLLSLLFLSILLMLEKSRRRIALGFGLGFSGLLVAGVLWIGIDVIVERYDTFFTRTAAIDDGRLIVYRDTVKMIQAFPQGIGVGAYADRFRSFQTAHLDVLFDHAHNDYLETIAEWGIIPGLLFWLGIAAVFVLIVRALLRSDIAEEQGILLTCSGALFALLLHSFADFNLQIPANAILFFSYIGIGLAILYPRKRYVPAA